MPVQFSHSPCRWERCEMDSTGSVADSSIMFHIPLYNRGIGMRILAMAIYLKFTSPDDTHSNQQIGNLKRLLACHCDCKRKCRSGNSFNSSAENVWWWLPFAMERQVFLSFKCLWVLFLFKFMWLFMYTFFQLDSFFTLSFEIRARHGFFFVPFHYPPFICFCPRKLR